MEVYLDNDRLETAQTTLGGMIDEVRQQLESTGRFIVEIRLDGESLDETAIIAAQDQTIEAEEVQLITADPIELAQQTLTAAQDALDAARLCQERAAELLQADDTKAAMEEVRSAITTWQQVQQTVLVVTQMLEVSLEELAVGDQTGVDIAQRLVGQLEQVRGQLESADWLGMADMLAYDLAEATGTWTQLLEALMHEADRGRNRSSDEGATGAGP